LGDRVAGFIDDAARDDCPRDAVLVSAKPMTNLMSTRQGLATAEVRMALAST
jgi:hypothetical protein